MYILFIKNLAATLRDRGVGGGSCGGGESDGRRGPTQVSFLTFVKKVRIYKFGGSWGGFLRHQQETALVVLLVYSLYHRGWLRKLKLARSARPVPRRQVF